MGKPTAQIWSIRFGLLLTSRLEVPQACFGVGEHGTCCLDEETQKRCVNWLFPFGVPLKTPKRGYPQAKDTFKCLQSCSQNKQLGWLQVDPTRGIPCSHMSQPKPMLPRTTRIEKGPDMWRIDSRYRWEYPLSLIYRVLRKWPKRGLFKLENT